MQGVRKGVAGEGAEAVGKNEVMKGFSEDFGLYPTYSGEPTKDRADRLHYQGCFFERSFCLLS